MKILLSGIQPSGNLHIGNYLGAIRQWAELQKSHRVFVMIADLHAITVPQEPKILREKTLELAALLIACGIEPQKSALFLQSHVPAHAEFGWILSTLTPVGELDRMTQFKEKKERAGTLAGLLNYPTLMAADILLYKPEVVPVGEDQIQHLELTRTLAKKFNNRFGETFPIPKALVLKEVARVMALDDPAQKMSKSAENPAGAIMLLDPPEVIGKKIKAAVTDSGKEVAYDAEKKPAVSNLMALYKALSGKSYEAIEKKYRGAGYAPFKKDLTELLTAHLTPIQKKYAALAGDAGHLTRILSDGSSRAYGIAHKTLREVKEKMGFIL